MPWPWRYHSWTSGNHCSGIEEFGTSDNAIVITGSLVLMIFSMAMVYLHERQYFGRMAKKDPDTH